MSGKAEKLINICEAAFAAVFLFIVKYELILYKPHKFKYIKINI